MDMVMDMWLQQKGGAFLDPLNDYQFLKKVSV
jgi:hypothetical protein